MSLPTKQVLTLEVAQQISAAAREESKKNGWNMVICIVDDGGHVILLERMDGTQLASVQVAQEKARAAVLFKRSTKVLEEAVAGGRIVVMTLANAVPVEGGVPITAGGQIIGAIGVSGATSAQDGQVAMAGLAAAGELK